MLRTLVLSSLLAVSLAAVPFKVSEKSGVSDVKVNQFMDCYDYSNQGGDRLRAIDYIPYLGDYNFDNRISACCVTGIWLLYADQQYNSNNAAASNYWLFGDNYCTNVPSQFDNVASSVRFTGAPDAWKADTLNLYLNEYFIGGEEYTYTDLPQMNYNDQTKSIVVTGCSAWTIYSDANYRGTCKCLYPASTSDCTPGFYSTQQSLGHLSGSISSARRGCYCSSKALPDNYGTKSQSNFGSHNL